MAGAVVVRAAPRLVSTVDSGEFGHEYANLGRDGGVHVKVDIVDEVGGVCLEIDAVEVVQATADVQFGHAITLYVSSSYTGPTSCNFR